MHEHQDPELLGLGPERVEPARRQLLPFDAALPAKIAETLYPLEISVEGGEVSGR